MHIFIRAEGNPSIGLGHIMRCFALAETCQALDIPVTFLCSQQTSDFLVSRHGFASGIVVLKHADDYVASNALVSNVILETNKTSPEPWLNEITSLLGATSVLLVDGYQFDFVYQSKLQQMGIKFAYFDDVNSFLTHNYQHPADIIINGAESAFLLNYHRNAANSTLCLGKQFLLLRREFHNLPELALEHRHSLLINFGGADANNYTTDLLKALSALGFSAPINVVTGAAFQHQDILKQYIEHDENASIMRIKHIHDAQDMASLMQSSKLAVCAAGGTQFELLSCGTPSILVVVADNQLPATQHAVKQDWCEMCDWRGKVDVIALAEQVLRHWQDEALIKVRYMKAMEQKQQITFDGAKRIVDALIELSF